MAKLKYPSYGIESMYDFTGNEMQPDKNFMGQDVTYGFEDSFATPDSPNLPGVGLQEQGLWDKTTDFLGSKTFGNVAAGAGMAADAYFKYQTLENERKFKDKMFDLQEGQIAKQDALRTGTQSAYAAGSGRTV